MHVEMTISDMVCVCKQIIHRNRVGPIPPMQRDLISRYLVS